MTELNNELVFSIDEYRTRVKNVQTAMAEKELDALLCHTLANINYLTGFESIAINKYWMVLIPSNGNPILLSQDFESHNAKIGSWLDDIVTYPIGSDYIKRTKDLLTSKGLHKKRLGVELNNISSLSAADYLRLRASLNQATLIDATSLVPKIMSIKTQAEIEYLRQAGRISSAGMQAAIDAAAEGKTDNELAAAAYLTMIKSGSEYMCIQPIVTVGSRSGIPHSTHKRIKLKKGDVILLEMGACIFRYSSPIMRTVVIGTPSDSVKQVAEACIASVNILADNMKPGVVASELAHMAKDVLRHLPKHLLWHGCYCYSIGPGFPPTWEDYAEIAVKEHNDKTILKLGMVFHTSTSIRDIGNFGTTCSETIVVTENGCEVLTNVPRKLFIR